MFNTKCNVSALLERFGGAELFEEYYDAVAELIRIQKIDKLFDDMADLGYEFEGMNTESEKLDKTAEVLLSEIESIETKAEFVYGITLSRTENGFSVDVF